MHFVINYTLSNAYKREMQQGAVFAYSMELKRETDRHTELNGMRNESMLAEKKTYGKNRPLNRITKKKLNNKITIMPSNMVEMLRSIYIFFMWKQQCSMRRYHIFSILR